MELLVLFLSSVVGKNCLGYGDEPEGLWDTIYLFTFSFEIFKGASFNLTWIVCQCAICKVLGNG